MKALKSIEEAAGLLVRIGRRVLLGEDELERFVATGQQQVEVEQNVAPAGGDTW